MVNAKLVKYFRDGVAAGSSIMSLRDDLLNSGWPQTEVDEAREVSSNEEEHSLVSKVGKGRIILAFGIFIFLLLIISLVAMGSESVDVTLKESDLINGQTLDVGRDLVEIQFDSVKTSKLRILEIGVISVTANLGEEKMKFIQDENQTIDLDSDGKKDILINLVEVKDNSPIFYFELSGKKVYEEAESVDQDLIDKALLNKN